MSPQIDFSTKLVCSIEKGIVKRQFPFGNIKNCHNAGGTRFTVLFKDHHDYELEAMSPQDKQKVSLDIFDAARTLTHQYSCQTNGCLSPTWTQPVCY